MNQVQREGLLVWMHSQIEKWGERFTKGLQIKLNTIIASYFAHNSMNAKAKKLSGIDKKIAKCKATLNEFKSQRGDLIDEIFKQCGFTPRGYTDRDYPYQQPFSIDEGDDILQVIQEECNSSIEVGNPRSRAGSLIERYTNGGIKLKINTFNSDVLREHIARQLEEEFELIENLDALRGNLQTKIMLLGNADEARQVVKVVKSAFK
jgi:hypothetical protein